MSKDGEQADATLIAGVGGAENDTRSPLCARAGAVAVITFIAAVMAAWIFLLGYGVVLLVHWLIP